MVSPNCIHCYDSGFVMIMKPSTGSQKSESCPEGCSPGRCSVCNWSFVDYSAIHAPTDGHQFRIG